MPMLPCPPPRTLYLRCLDASSRPAGYVGDWPRRGGVYAGKLLPHFATGEVQVQLAGFHAEPPWGAFAARRFVVVADIWLN